MNSTKSQPNQYHLLITLDCCCLSYRMFSLIFKSMSIPGKLTVNILFHNISKKTRTVFPLHTITYKHIVPPCLPFTTALPCPNNNVPLFWGQYSILTSTITWPWTSPWYRKAPNPTPFPSWSKIAKVWFGDNTSLSSWTAHVLIWGSIHPPARLYCAKWGQEIGNKPVVWPRLRHTHIATTAHWHWMEEWKRTFVTFN